MFGAALLIAAAGAVGGAAVLRGPQLAFLTLCAVGATFGFLILYRIAAGATSSMAAALSACSDVLTVLTARQGTSAGEPRPRRLGKGYGSAL